MTYSQNNFFYKLAYLTLTFDLVTLTLGQLEHLINMGGCGINMDKIEHAPKSGQKHFSDVKAYFQRGYFFPPKRHVLKQCGFTPFH